MGISQQFQLQLKVAVNPPQYLADWENQKQLVIFSVATSPGIAPIIRLQTTIQKGNTVVARTDIKRMPNVRMDQPVKIFYTDDLLPSGVLLVSLPDNKLTEGDYTLCVQVYDETGQKALTQPSCQPFTIRTYQQPQLILPANQSVLLPAQAKTIQFRWTPVAPAPTGIVTYKLQVFEVMNGQYPEQAVRSNQPVLEKELPGATQFIWIPQNDIQPIQYVWTVQAIDREGRPLGRNDGRATPFTFSLRPTNPQLPDCNSCGYWKQISLINGATQQLLTVNCGQTYHIPCHQQYYIPNLTYQCNDSNCITIGWLYVYGPSGLLTNSGINSINNSNFPPNGLHLNVPFNQPGTYQLIYYGECGQKSCDTCKITIIAECEENNCSCGIWKTLSMRPDWDTTIASTALSCGKTYPVLCNKKYDFKFKYQCNPDSCNTSYTFQMKDPQGNIVSTTTDPGGTDTFVFTSSGTYTQSIIASCGGRVCDTCRIYYVANCLSDCCNEVIRDIKDQTPWINGNQLNLNTIFTTTIPIQSVEATVISMQSTVNCIHPGSSSTQTIPPILTGGYLSGYAVIHPYPAEIDFLSGGSTTVSPMLQLQLPAAPTGLTCTEKINICIRYLLRYNDCKTCELIRCYSIRRNGGVSANSLKSNNSN